jgi:nucleotide-binding universal stress UspA family protein
MKSLLLATDLSSRSERALLRAASLVRQFDCPWFILHVVDSDQPQLRVELEVEQIRRDLQARLGEFTERAGRAPEIWVEAGDPAPRIAECARWGDIDLLVMGVHRRNALRDVFVGTTLERVVRTCEKPVLVVNREPESSYRDLVLALDLSPTSARAVRAAKALGLMDGARCRAVHAFEPFAKVMLMNAGIATPMLDDHLSSEERNARLNLAGFLEEQGLLGVVGEQRVEEGLPMTVLRRVMADSPADLLVLGTRGMGGIKRVLIGSVADAALREFECDILAVPPGRD